MSLARHRRGRFARACLWARGTAWDAAWLANVSKGITSHRGRKGVLREQHLEAKVQRAVHSAGAELSLSVAVSSITAPGF